MKIRNGFVSNSSSSSFILRGMKLTRDEIVEKLNILEEEFDNFDDYDAFEYICSKLPDFSIEFDGNYFGMGSVQMTGQDYNTYIVGESMGSLTDGEATELPDRTAEEDKLLLDKFESLGFTGKLKTYIQMVSNDNY